MISEIDKLMKFSGNVRIFIGKTVKMEKGEGKLVDFKFKRESLKKI